MFGGGGLGFRVYVLHRGYVGHGLFGIYAEMVLPVFSDSGLGVILHMIGPLMALKHLRE